MTKKILISLFSILVIGAFAFLITWGCMNANKVKQGLSGTGLYNKEDINNAYEDGYNTAFKDKEEYDKLINGYRDNITILNDQVSKLNSQATILTNTNKDYENQILNLSNLKIENEKTIANFKEIIKQNDETILNCNNTIDTLQKQIKILSISEENKKVEIEQLNLQIDNLQSLISQLQITNELNLSTIDNLNNQIVNLNNQISEMTLQMQNNTTIVNSLNNKISELEKSVSYYEQYIAGLETGTQVVATFEFNGSIYNIQILNKNDIASVTTPISTDYVQFNYWSVNGVQVDLNTYQITTNTKFVANVTNRYDVKFKVDSNIVDSQIITKNNFATLPTTPIKVGYEFLGWSLNNLDIVNDINNIAVTQNTIYIAVFAKLHTVNFLYEDEILETQNIKNGNYATNVNVESTPYKIFNGWKVNGSIVNIASYKITGAVTFVADITYKYDVNFKVDETIIDSKIIVKNSFATLPIAPTKNGYVFDGWTINGINLVNVNTYTITQNTTFIAKFTKTFVVKFMVDNNQYNLQTIKLGNAISIPATPVKNGYTFNGWTIDGNNIINVGTYNLNSDTTFIAKFSKNISWQSLYSGSNNLNFGTGNNKTTNINGLTTTDTFRVTFSKIAFEDGYDSGCSMWYYTTKNINGKNITNNMNNASSLTLENGQEFTINTATSTYNAKLIVTCSQNGVLNVSFRIVNSSGNLALTKYFGSISLTIASVEVYR